MEFTHAFRAVSFPISLPTGQIQIGPVFFQSSFSILEDQPMDMLLGLDMLKRHQVSHSSMYSPLNPFSTDCANTACYNWCESATAVHCHKLTIQAASLAHCGGCPSGQPRSLQWLSKWPASLTAVAVQAASLTAVAI